MKRYYMLKWETQKYNMPNNYVRGYEVFTNKEEAKKYAESLRKDNIKVEKYLLMPSDLTEVINTTPTENTIKTNYGYVENSGFQFH